MCVHVVTVRVCMCVRVCWRRARVWRQRLPKQTRHTQTECVRALCVCLGEHDHPAGYIFTLAVAGVSTYGSRADFTCDSAGGRYSSGTGAIYCGADGAWDQGRSPGPMMRFSLDLLQELSNSLPGRTHSSLQDHSG